jgi:PmbA protein
MSHDEVLSRLIDRAKAAGADACDAWVVERASLSVSTRLGALEGLEREETRAASIRILIGQRQAAASGSDLRPEALDALADRVAEMAKVASPDPWAGLADPDRLARDIPDLGLADDHEPTAQGLEDLARAAEEAGRAVPGVTNSAGSSAWSARTRSSYATSHGFRGGFSTTSRGYGLSVLAEKDGAKERDYDGDGMRRWADLMPAQAIGRSAGERAVARLGAVKIESGKAPVIFEARVARRLVAAFASAISGAAVARGVSFLREKLGQQVFAKGVAIVDDPLIPGGLGSHPFDGEGVACAPLKLIDDGVLTSWLLNSSAARQLGLATTGHASAGLGSPPGLGPSNLWLMPGERDFAGLMADAGEGLVVNEMFSPSLNPTNGDYSVGVAGQWFRGGQRAYPVHEVTVAGNLVDIFARLIPGADLDRRHGVDSPSILVDDLAVAGR